MSGAGAATGHLANASSLLHSAPAERVRHVGYGAQQGRIAAGRRRARVLLMELLPIQRFAGAANQTFELSLGGSAMTLTLVEVRPLPARPFPGMLRDPFSLLFRSASALMLPQRIYRMTNATVGTLDIFIVPIGRDAAGVTYQAIFN